GPRRPAVRAEGRLRPGRDPRAVAGRGRADRGRPGGDGQVAPQPGQGPPAGAAGRPGAGGHMSDAYEEWKRGRAGAEPGAGFTERVMAAVRARGAPRTPLLVLLLSSRAVRGGLWVLAGLALAARTLAVLALFHPR